MFCPEPVPSLPRVKIERATNRACVGQRILGAIDLAIDFATLGEYGLEPLPAQAGGPADGPCRERPGHCDRMGGVREGSPRGLRRVAALATGARPRASDELG